MALHYSHLGKTPSGRIADSYERVLRLRKHKPGVRPSGLLPFPRNVEIHCETKVFTPSGPGWIFVQSKKYQGVSTNYRRFRSITWAAVQQTTLRHESVRIIQAFFSTFVFINWLFLFCIYRSIVFVHLYLRLFYVKEYPGYIEILVWNCHPGACRLGVFPDWLTLGLCFWGRCPSFQRNIRTRLKWSDQVM